MNVFNILYIIIIVVVIIRVAIKLSDSNTIGAKTTAKGHDFFVINQNQHANSLLRHISYTLIVLIASAGLSILVLILISFNNFNTYQVVTRTLCIASLEINQRSFVSRVNCPNSTTYVK